MNADSLAIGFLCAALVRSGFKLSTRWLVSAALAAGALVVFANLENSPATFLRGTTLAILYSSILLLATRGSFAILQSPLLRFFGTISYALYLVHQSALVLVLGIARRAGLATSATIGSILLPRGAFLLSIAACWLSWIYFERPLVSWARGRFHY